MDKKKLLLVAVSVGIFLVIAVGAAILYFGRERTAPAAMAAYPYPVGGQTGITVAPPSSLPTVSGLGATVPSGSGLPGTGTAGLEPPPGEAPVPAPGAGALTDSPPAGSTAQGGDGNSGTVISVPRPVSAAVPEAPPAGRAVPAAKPAPAPAPAAAKPAPRPAAPAPAPTRIYDDYWVQTGAFSTVATAEGVKETLAARGITSLIENREVEGRTLYRVRVGPYTSQNEADYWLTLIKGISGFEDSQVRQTRSRR